MARLILFAVIGIIAVIIAVIKIALGHVTGNQNLQNTTWRGETKKAMDKTAKGISWMEQQWEESKRRASVSEIVPSGRVALDQYNHGCFLFDNGQYDEAVTCFRAAAKQGIVGAQSGLGVCYYEGKGVSQDTAEAVNWFRLAAEHGNAVAQFALGRCYQHGHGVPPNDYEGVHWIRKAAEQGHPSAQVLLAINYYEGQGVAQDYAEAFKWISLASKVGNNPDTLHFRNMFLNYLTPQQISEGQRRAEAFLSGQINAATTPALENKNRQLERGNKRDQWLSLAKSVDPDSPPDIVDCTVVILFSCELCSENCGIDYEKFSKDGWPLCSKHQIKMRPYGWRGETVFN